MKIGQISLSQHYGLYVWVNPSCHDLGAKTCPIITTSNPYLLGPVYLPGSLPLEFSPSPQAVTLQRQCPRAAHKSCQLAEASPEGFLSQRTRYVGSDSLLLLRAFSAQSILAQTL